jgi:hypothetical protein
LGHGVSLLWWRSGGFEHPHDTPPYPFTPSPTFVHSSRALSERERAMSIFEGGRPDRNINITIAVVVVIVIAVIVYYLYAAGYLSGIV